MNIKQSLNASKIWHGKIWTELEDKPGYYYCPDGVRHYKTLNKKNHWVYYFNRKAFDNPRYYTKKN